LVFSLLETKTMSEPATPRRVLIADNSRDLAEVLGEIIRMDDTLEFVGYVTTGAEALTRSRAGVADVLILDLGLEDCHGFEVLERLRTESSPIRVIVHTGHSSKELEAHALRKGAAAYIVKTGDPEILLAAIHAA
jgi:DNA-binding NarL/FixJ family response regulator